MNIIYLELSANDLQEQNDFYANVLELPVKLSAENLEVQVGETKLIFTQADADFNGAYHFAFNIPENQFHAAKAWLARRIPILHDKNGKEDFESEDWNSHSLYFKDVAGNILEFIARHNLKNAVDGEFDGSQILNVSEIGMPSEDVIAFANEICNRLGLSVFKQEPSVTFTPVVMTMACSSCRSKIESGCRTQVSLPNCYPSKCNAKLMAKPLKCVVCLMRSLGKPDYWSLWVDHGFQLTKGHIHLLRTRRAGSHLIGIKGDH